MKSFAALLLLCVSLVALHAQSPTQIIHGRVIAADTGNPLPHARVVIYNDATPLPALFTDIDGRFESKPLTTGRYRLSVTKAGYALASMTRLDAASPDGVDVHMQRSAAIAGRVLDPTGEPAIGVIVGIAEPPADGTPPVPAKTTTVRTDDLGEYRFAGLTAGTYIVAVTSLSVQGDGRVMSNPWYYPGVAAVGDAQRISVQPGDQKSGIDFSSITTQITSVTIQPQVITGSGLSFDGITLTGATIVMRPNGLGTQGSTDVAKGTGVIRGRLTRNDGVALAHASVMMVMSQAPGDRAGIGMLQSVQTDDDGRYEFVQLPRGEYRITGNKSGFISASYGQKSATEPGGEAVTLVDNQTRARIDFVLPRYSAITGQIFDDFGDPVEGVNVSVAQIRFQAGRRRLVRAGNVGPATDDLGRYRVFNLPPGQYVVTASVGQLADTGAAADVSGFATTYFPGTANAREAQRVAVPLSQDLTGVDFTLAPTTTATISGTRLGSDGQPMAGWLKLLESERSDGIIASAVGARTWTNGRFVFPNVPPGDYVIQAGSGKSEPSTEGNFVSQFVTVTGSDISDLLLQASPGSTIGGRVIFDGDGTPPSYRTLAVIPERADLDRTPDNGSIARAEVARDLTFTMSGIRGPRRLVIDRNNTSGWGLKSVMANGVDVTDTPIDFGTPAQSLSDVQVILTDRLTEVRTSIVDSHGQPTQDYALLVFSEDRERWYAGSRFFRRAAPDSTGAVTVRGLPPGEYYLAPVATSSSVLKDGADAWQDPEFLDAIAFRATRVTLAESQKLTVSARLITP